MMFKLIGALMEAMVWPSIIIAKDGGLILTAIHLIQHPTDKSTPAMNS